MKNEKEKKKLKSRILSAVVIFIGVVLVFAGYWAMQQLLNRRQERLLSQSGETKTALDEDADSEGEEQTKLTAEELEDILIRTELTSETNPHEPYGRQMTMQEAIETGQTWIENFCAKYGFPSADGTVSYEGISAALYTGQLDQEMRDSLLNEIQETDAFDASMSDASDAEANAAETSETDSDGTSTGTDAATDANSATDAGDGSWTENTDAETGESETETGTGVELSEDSGSELAESMYGYWDLTFSGTDMDINMKINAVTGQVLSVSMNCGSYTTSVKDLSRLSIVQEYFQSFGFEETDNIESGSFEVDDDSYYVDYDGKLFFVLETYTYEAAELGYPEGSGYMESGFSMYVHVNW